MHLHKPILLKFIIFLIAFQVLNTSIDAPNAEADYHYASGGFNYIDSYVEYVSEVLMKCENAIPEPVKRQPKELQTHKFYQVICEQAPCSYVYVSGFSSTKSFYFTCHDNYAYQFIKEISPPPENAAYYL